MAKRNTTDTIVIHCTQTPPGMDVDVEKVTQWHTERGFDTIGYHYLIKRDGTLQEGRQQDEVGAHAVAVNGTSIGVALVGGGTPSMGWENNFAPIQFETLKTILLKLKREGLVRNLFEDISYWRIENKFYYGIFIEKFIVKSVIKFRNFVRWIKKQEKLPNPDADLVSGM